MIHSSTAPYAALTLRVSLGILFVAHGLLKLLVFTPAGTAGFFESLGLPGFLAYLTITLELIGGPALILGIATRWVSLTLLPILIGAALFAHSGNGWLFANEGGGWEFPVFWAMALIAQALLGDGPFAVRLPTATKAAEAAQ